MSRGVGTFLALLGLAVSILTFYYGRQDHSTDNRPVLDVAAAQLITREDTDGREYDRAKVTVVNHGNRVASPTYIKLRDFDSSVDWDDRGTIAPNQSIDVELLAGFDASKFNHLPIRFNIELKYGDRSQPSHSFTDDTPMCAASMIGSAPYLIQLGDPGFDAKKALGYNNGPPERFPYATLPNPETLNRCGAVDDSMWADH